MDKFRRFANGFCIFAKSLNFTYMATILRTLAKRVGKDGRAEILLRVSISRNARARIRSGIFVPVDKFVDGVFKMPRVNGDKKEELRALENELIALERFIITLGERTPASMLTPEYLRMAVNRFKHPDFYSAPDSCDFMRIFEESIERRKLSTATIKGYMVLARLLQRYELYRRATDTPNYLLTLDGFTIDEVNALEKFARNEHKIFTEYPEIYKAVPLDTRKGRNLSAPKPRGDNAIIALFNRLRAFFAWCNTLEYTKQQPFAKYTGVTVERYGTPYFITLEERDKIADYDLSATPALAVQRDIFIFHCFVGCRVSDLLRLTGSNVINGAIEYVAKKTGMEKPDTIRVPLHPRAAALVAKYAGVDPNDKLFPFISSQRYNEDIKKIFTVCGVTRLVTVRDSLTGEDVQRPINELASSHIARRTFCGNLYRQLKDPNLIGRLSGHTEGSKAFVRYRDIDEDTKKEVINLLS